MGIVLGGLYSVLFTLAWSVGRFTIHRKQTNHVVQMSNTYKPWIKWISGAFQTIVGFGGFLFFASALLSTSEPSSYFIPIIAGYICSTSKTLFSLVLYVITKDDGLVS